MDERDSLTGAVIGAAIEVHRVLGPGLLESVYQRAMEHELTLRGVAFQPQLPLPIAYKGLDLGDNLILDFLIDGELVVELKAVDALLGVHDAQLLTYLRLGRFRRGLLINFNVRLLKDGVRRLIL